jgi:DNA-binding HxlR family transcriptional regulator
MSMSPHGEGPICQHFQRAAELIARRWVPQVIYAMQSGPRRYTELKAGIPPISDAVLSERLKELEVAEIVIRTVEPSTPVRIEYALTPRGDELAAVLGELQVWAERWAREPVVAPMP